MGEVTYTSMMEASSKLDAAGKSESAAKLRASARAKFPDEADKKRGFKVQAATSMADTAGGIMDVLPTNAPASMMPLVALSNLLSSEPADEPGTSDKLKGVFESLGIPYSDAPPETLSEGAGSGAGAALSMLVPGMVGAKAATVLPGFLGRMGGHLAKSLSTPGGILAELGSGAVSGASSEAAREAGGNELVQLAAGILGPIGVAMGPSSVLLRGSNAIRNKLKNAAADAPNAAKLAARTRFSEAVGGEDAVRDIEKTLGSGVNPLGLPMDMLLRNPGATALAEIAASHSAPAAAARAAAIEAAQTKAVGQLDAMGGAAKDLNKSVVDRIKAISGKAMSAASKKQAIADAAADAIAPPGILSTSSARAVDKLKKAKTVAKDAEQAAWNSIDDRVQTGVSNTKNALAAVTKKFSGDIDSAITNIFPDIGKVKKLSVKLLNQKRGDLLRIARSADKGATPNMKLKSQALAMAQGIADDIDAYPVGAAMGKAVKAANKATRDYYETFRQGNVAKVFTKKGTGEGADPATVIQDIMSAPARKIPTALRELHKAAPDSVDDAFDVLRDKFVKAAKPAGGTFSQTAAARWKENYKEALAMNPKLSGMIDDAMAAQGDAAKFAEKTKARLSAAEKTPTASLASTASRRVIPSLLDAPDPAMAARVAANAAKKDKSGAALKGLQRAGIEHIMPKTGNEMIGSHLSDILANKKTNAVLTEIFTPLEMSGIEDLAKAMEVAATKGSNVNEALRTKGNDVLRLALQWAALNTPRLTANELKEASVKSGYASRVADMINKDGSVDVLMKAMNDPEKLLEIIRTVSRKGASDPGTMPFISDLMGAGAATYDSSRDDRKSQRQ
jgi:hypothetical protein